VPLGPTVRRRRLGAELRRLREAHSLKLEEVAEKLGLAPSTLSRIETGKAPTKTAYLAAMLEMYNVEDPGIRKVLVDMAREGHRKGWRSIYDDVLPSGFDIYVRTDSDVAYTESPGGMIYLEKDREVRSCAEAFDRMRAAALSPAASVELIQRVLHQSG
jgi:transcriptional regulator with XRE-family HTH domain